MPDCQINRPLRIAVQLNDANGQPQTAGGAAATITVYGPASATSPVHTAAAALNGADGLWGVTVPATAHTVAGVYTYRAGAITDGASDGTIGGVYAVGQVSPDQLSLWDIYLAVTLALRDGRQGRATTLSGTTTLSLTDLYYKGWGSTNNWVGAHVLLPYVGTATDSNPLRISAFDQVNGVFTLANATAAGPATPFRYILGGQRGFGHQQKLDAIQRAIRDARPRLPCSDEVSLSGALFTFQYAIPDYWTSIRGVYLRNRVSLWQGDWEEVAPIHWPVRPDRRLLQIDYMLTSQVQIRVDGRFRPPAPQFLTSSVDAPAEFVINRALEYLCAESPDDSDKKMLQYYAAKAEAAEPTMSPDANEVSL